MANTYTCLYYHLVFSTKRRLPWLTEDIQGEVWAYLGGIARKNGMIALAIGGHIDHAHILVRTKPIISVSKMLQLFKGGSSFWIHQTFAGLRGFRWQDGYAAFTVSQSDIEAIVRYIRGQQMHHKKGNFREEYLTLLHEHDVEYDPKYVWD